MLTLTRPEAPPRLFPAAPRPRHARRYLVPVALVVVALISALSWYSNPLLTHFLFRSPNHGRVEIPMTPSAELARHGVSRELRIPAGTPVATLSVWIIEPQGKAATASVLLLHGLYDTMRSQLGLANTLAAHGYQAILVDLRGHGQSTGDWLTYGAQEVPDLVEVLRVLRERNLLRGPVGVFGSSYGAAIALQLAAREPGIRAVIAVGAYSSVEEAAMGSIRSTPLALEFTPAEIREALRQGAIKAGVELQGSSPIEAIARTNAATLLVHGEDDACVPIAQAEANLRAGAPRAQLLRIPSTGHFGVFRDRSGQLSTATLEWLARWLR